ncbi:transketolase family protein [Butyrivibrio sp. INlla16]|uniref:transketolase family protein n=1 Tax=Butyrivibrio sp. INlla16 TaxID=1520807 RepID=UPI00088F2FA2|nr:transketolase C-terminal domain-containing protein [Butyrivibrio sp. INlla16]SDB60110.1 transketolase [Butyrivibrio sp. INlla16]
MRTAYLNTLYDLAMNDKRVYALISDNGAIVYDKYRKDLSEQYLNIGISEANMLGMAAGMASRGKIPFAYTIGSFLAYRAYEFIRNDVCLQNQNVKIVGTGAGEVYSALGPTHHTTEDLGGLRSLPNLTILSPASPMEVMKATRAAYEFNGPIYLRLGTNKEPEIYDNDYEYVIGKGIALRDGDDLTIVGTGSILKDVLDVVDKLKSDGISIRVINIHTIKPFDREIIEAAIDETGKILTVEDHNVIGGIGSAVSEVIAEYGKAVEFKRIGLKGFSSGYGTYAEVKQNNGVGKEQIAQAIRDLM